MEQYLRSYSHAPHMHRTCTCTHTLAINCELNVEQMHVIYILFRRWQSRQRSVYHLQRWSVNNFSGPSLPCVPSSILISTLHCWFYVWNYGAALEKKNVINFWQVYACLFVRRPIFQKVPLEVYVSDSAHSQNTAMATARSKHTWFKHMDEKLRNMGTSPGLSLRLNRGLVPPTNNFHWGDAATGWETRLCVNAIREKIKAKINISPTYCPVWWMTLSPQQIVKNNLTSRTKG